MPSFNPFTSVTGKNAVTLFDIRLDSDFLVFRGNEHESTGQLLKGVVAVCVPGPTRIEDIRLRLTGTQRLAWNDPRPTGVSNQTKVDRTTTILEHRWPSFWGTPGKSSTLEKGNYEFPFELLLPGDTAESVEGLPEASITYKLKATIARGKLAYDLHAYKHVRVVRTLESSALEFLHAMSVENIWPNKVEYSIVVPQKAIVFGSVVPIQMRFTPLLKGLEIGEITIKLLEIHDIIMQDSMGHSLRDYKREKAVTAWALHITREEHWQEMIEDTGQEGWVLDTELELPQKLGRCIQDVNVHGIKIRHKLKLTVALKNPDGHISELRATLPVTIFISPNIPLDEEGNLVRPAQVAGTTESSNSIAPPGYGEHVLDQLYDEVDTSSLQTPAAQSGVNSPIYNQSRSGSDDNLTGASAGAIATTTPSRSVPAAALSSRLQNVSLDASSSRRNPSIHSNLSVTGGSGANSPFSSSSAAAPDSAATTPPPLSRHPSSGSSSAHSSPEHVDLLPDQLLALCKVPSYATAMKSARVPALQLPGSQLPDYRTAVSAPGTPTWNRPDPLAAAPLPAAAAAAAPAIVTGLGQRHRRGSSLGLSLTIPSDLDERRFLYLRRAREGVV